MSRLVTLVILLVVVHGLPAVEESVAFGQGVTVPKSFMTLFKDGRHFEFYQSARTPELALKEVFPAIPPRSLPILTTGDGDLVLLHLPRGGGAPLLLDFNHEESLTGVLTSDLSAFAINPDRWCWRYEGADKPVREVTPGVLGPDQVAGIRDAESLYVRNWWLSSWFLLEDREDKDGRLAAARDTAHKLLRESGPLHLLQAFPTVKSVSETAPWLSLVDYYAAAKDWNRAFTCGDNALQTCFLYPRNGEQERKPILLWHKVQSVLEHLAPLVAEHGDDLERATQSRMLSVAKDFAKDEKSLPP